MKSPVLVKIAKTHNRTPAQVNQCSFGMDGDNVALQSIAVVLIQVCSQPTKLTTNDQILVRWSLERGFITLPKSVTPSRIEENFDVFSFSLTKEEVKELNALDEDYHTGWDPTTIK